MGFFLCLIDFLYDFAMTTNFLKMPKIVDLSNFISNYSDSKHGNEPTFFVYIIKHGSFNLGSFKV